MDTSKWIGTSVTFWGIIISVASTLAPLASQLVGWEVSPVDVQEIGQHGTSWLQVTGQLVGAVMALIGRHRARTTVTILP